MVAHQPINNINTYAHFDFSRSKCVLLIRKAVYVEKMVRVQSPDNENTHRSHGRYHLLSRHGLYLSCQSGHSVRNRYGQRCAIHNNGISCNHWHSGHGFMGQNAVCLSTRHGVERFLCLYMISFYLRIPLNETQFLFLSHGAFA